MFTLIMTMFIVSLIIFGSLFSLALKASWGIIKIALGLFALPLALVGILMSGFALLFLPALLILVLFLIFGLVL